MAAAAHHWLAWRGAALRGLALLLAASLVAGGALAQRGREANAEVKTTEFVAREFWFEGRSELVAGWHNIRLRNAGSEPHHLQYALLNDGVSPEQFFEALAEEGEGALRLATLTGGVGLIPPHRSAEALVNLSQPGTYVLLCLVTTDEGVPHFARGMTDVLVVTGEAADGPEEPEADVVVRMSDFAFSMPSTVPAGELTWRVVNDGPQPHEMVLLRLNEGVEFGELMEALRGGEDATTRGRFMGGTQALNVGLSSYATYDLEPGEYAALCLVTDPQTGSAHVALGMVAGFTVEGRAR